MRRRIVVRKDDVLVVNGVDLDGEILKEIVSPSKRLLWAFVKNENGDVQPIPFSEEQCVWLQDSDLSDYVAPRRSRSH